MLAERYRDIVAAGMEYRLTETNFNFGQKYRGKVRDTYDLGDRLLLITTDRLSAFDRVLAAIPFKGQVLNLTSAFWFGATQHIIDNHVLAIPDPNVTLAKKCEVFPVEFIVRGYMTGSTSTSLWTHYNNGVRDYCGNMLSDGMCKNQKLVAPILTPTTKEAHDRPVSCAEIIELGLMTAAELKIAADAALRLYQFGVAEAAKRGLLLVDTKYEMGRDAAGNIVLVDEIHTPDSSRYWIADSYTEHFARGEEPDSIDKEFLRLWFVKNCDPYNDKVLPAAPDDQVQELAARYIRLYEMITGQDFAFPDQRESIQARLQKNICAAVTVP